MIFSTRYRTYISNNSYSKSHFQSDSTKKYHNSHPIPRTSMNRIYSVVQSYSLICMGMDIVTKKPVTTCCEQKGAMVLPDFFSVIQFQYWVNVPRTIINRVSTSKPKLPVSNTHWFVTNVGVLLLIQKG